MSGVLQPRCYCKRQSTLNATEVDTNVAVSGIKAEYIAGQKGKCGIESIKQEIAARGGWGWRVTISTWICTTSTLILPWCTEICWALFLWGKVDKSPAREAQLSISLFLKCKTKYFSHRNFTTSIINPRCLLSFQVRIKLLNSIFMSVKCYSFAWGFFVKNQRQDVSLSFL